MARGAAGKAARKEARANARANGGKAPEAEDEDAIAGYFGQQDEDSTYDIGEDGKKKKEAAEKKKSIPPVSMGVAEGDDPFGFKRQAAAEAKRNSASCCDGGGCEDDKEDEVVKKIKKGKKREKLAKLEDAHTAKGLFGEIKLLPLIFLLLLTGSTLLPAAFWVLDNAGPMLGKTNLTGRLGYRFGIGSTPKKRVVTFYEKHAPEKIHEVDSIVSKYYGDYKTLTKKLERKYQDYGYFVGWEQDEAPSKLALAEFGVHVKAAKQYYRKNAPAAIVQASDNFYYNVGGLAQQGRKVWDKTIWPILKPIIYIPDEKEAKRQKAEDKKKYGKKPKGRRKKNSEFRDEEED